jgi:hypothetical protein
VKTIPDLPPQHDSLADIRQSSNDFKVNPNNLVKQLHTDFIGAATSDLNTDWLNWSGEVADRAWFRLVSRASKDLCSIEKALVNVAGA